MKHNLHIILIFLSGAVMPVVAMDKAVAELQQMKLVDLPTVFDLKHPIINVIHMAYFEFVGEKNRHDKGLELMCTHKKLDEMGVIALDKAERLIRDLIAARS